MSWKGCLALIAFGLSVGCGTFATAIVATGTTGYQFYNHGKIQEVYCVSMETAYKSAILTMVGLDLMIEDIKIGEKRRIIKSRAEVGKHEITVDLETLNPGKYVRVIFKATENSIMPDRAYGLMFMMEFNKNVSVGQTDPAG